MAHITIPSQSLLERYEVGSTPQSVFHYAKRFILESDIAVYNQDSLIDPADYTFVGTPDASGVGYDGGTLTLDTAVSNTVIVINHEAPVERLTDFPNAGKFNIIQLNTELDQMILLLQQVQGQVDRAILFPVDTEYSDILFPDPEQGKHLAWGANGTLVNEEGSEALVGATYRYEEQEATEGQTAIILNEIVINPGKNDMSLSINGSWQRPSEYTKTSSTRIDLNTPLKQDDDILVVVGMPLTTAADIDASDVTYQPASGPATNVETHLRSLDSQVSTNTSDISSNSSRLTALEADTRIVEEHDGGLASYTLSATPAGIDSTDVYVSGSHQTRTKDYTLAGNILTPTTVWPSGTNNVVIKYGSVTRFDLADATTTVDIGGDTHANATFSDTTPAVVRAVYSDTKPKSWNLGYGVAGVEFDVIFNDYFAANPSGHCAVGLRIDTDVITTDVRGQGMVFGNVTAAAGGPAHAPTTLLQTWHGGLGAPASQRGLFAESAGTDTRLLEDGVQYKVILTAMQASDDNSYIRYRLYRWNATYGAWDLERDTGDVKDDNTWADLTKSGLVFAHVFNSDLVPWSVEFTNIRSFWIPARDPVTQTLTSDLGATAEFDGNLAVDLNFTATGLTITGPTEEATLSDNLSFMNPTGNTNFYVRPGSGFNNAGVVATSNNDMDAASSQIWINVDSSGAEVATFGVAGGTVHPLDFKCNTETVMRLKSELGHSDPAVILPILGTKMRIRSQEFPLENRFAIQDYTAGNGTELLIIPGASGGNGASLICSNNNDLTLAAGQIWIGCTNTEANVSVFAVNGGTIPDMIFGANGIAVEAFRIKGSTGLVNFTQTIQLPSASARLGTSAGYATPTGTATRTSFNTATVTTAQLAERVKALIDDLKARSVI